MISAICSSGQLAKPTPNTTSVPQTPPRPTSHRLTSPPPKFHLLLLPKPPNKGQLLPPEKSSNLSVCRLPPQLQRLQTLTYPSVNIALRYIPQVISKGFHFCSMDFAGCGNSGGDYVSLGYHERWDALKLLQELRDRWGVREIIIWGRSMGAVTAIKLYSLLNDQQNCEKSGEIRILALVLDSAFISLKRMVVEVGSTQINMPELLVKALFLLVGSSIEKRANFKLDQLELGQDVERIRCPAMLLASKEDTFVNCSHSEEIFGRLALKDHKQMEYIGGQHYQQRTEPVFAAILQFMERKYKLFSQHAPRQLRVSYCLKQQGTVQRPFRSLKRYQPRK